MHPRIEELDQYLCDARQALRRAVDSVPERDHATPPPGGGWSVIAVLEHLAIVESRIAALLAARCVAARAEGVAAERDTAAILPSLHLERFLNRGRRLEAPAGVQPKADGDAPSCWAALHASRTAMQQALAAADGLALSEITAPHPLLGTMNFYEWIGFVGAHERRHADQIREVGASLGGRAD